MQGECNEAKMRYSFVVKIPERTYELLAQSALEMNDWIACLKEEVRTPYTACPLSIAHSTH
jgi:hypothetical protein